MANALSELKREAVNAHLTPKEMIPLAEALESVMGEAFARGYLCRCLKEDDLLAPLDEKIIWGSCRENLRSIYADWRSSPKPLPKHRLTENAGSVVTQERKPARISETLNGKSDAKTSAESHLESEADDVRAHQEQLSAELRDANSQLESTRAELSLTRTELEMSRSMVADLTQVREKLASELTQVRDELAQQGNALQHVRSALDARTAEIQTLKDGLALTEQAFAEAKCVLEEKEACIRQKESFLPPNVSAWAALLFQDRIPELVDLAVFYSCASMLGMTDREGREFLNRFKRFDRELFLTYMDDKERLGYWRMRYQTLLNQELQAFAIKWDLDGDVYDDSIHLTHDSSGSTVTSVESALVTAKSNNSCKLRALVHTQK